MGPSMRITFLLLLVGFHPSMGFYQSEKNKKIDKYECLPGEHMYYIQSDYDKSGKDDRLWVFDCRKGFVSTDAMDCQWTSWFNSGYDQQSLVKMECVQSGVKSAITGIESEYSRDDEDRRWKLKCCKWNSDELQVRPEMELNSEYEGSFDVSLPRSQVPTGITLRSRHDKDWMYSLNSYVVTKCEATSMKIIDVPQVVFKGRKNVGAATAINCDGNRTIEAEIGSTNELEEGF